MQELAEMDPEGYEMGEEAEGGYVDEEQYMA